MYEFHGWLRSDSTKPIDNLKKNLPKNNQLPIFIGYVNGLINVNFCGNPNRDRGELSEILNYLTEIKYCFSGIVYVNDSDAEDYDKFRVFKIFNDKVTIVKDSVFCEKELQTLFW